MKKPALKNLWPQINRLRGELIDRQYCQQITLVEIDLLNALQVYADEHLRVVRIKQFPCSLCLAKPGEPCMDGAGKPVRFTHAAREVTANAIFDLK
jgi:hypothetical protein